MSVTIYSKDDVAFTIPKNESSMLSDLVDITIAQDEKIIIPYSEIALRCVTNNIIDDPDIIIEILNAIDFLHLNKQKLQIYKTFSFDGMVSALQKTDRYYPIYYLTNIIKLLSLFGRDNIKWDIDFVEFLLELVTTDKFIEQQARLLQDNILFNLINVYFEHKYKAMYDMIVDLYKDSNIVDGVFTKNILHYIDKISSESFSSMYCHITKNSINKIFIVIINNTNDVVNLNETDEPYKIKLNNYLAMLNILIYDVDRQTINDAIALSSHNNNLWSLEILKQSKYFGCPYDGIDKIKYTATDYTKMLCTLRWWLESGAVIKYFDFIKDKIKKNHHKILIEIKKIDCANVFIELNNYLINKFFFNNHKCSSVCQEYDIDVIKHFISEAIVYNCSNSLEKCKNHGIVVIYKPEIITQASDKKATDSLNWLVLNNHMLPNTGAIYNASIQENIQMLEWWKNSGLLLTYDEQCVDDSYNKLKSIKWWVDSGLPLKYSNLCLANDAVFNKSINTSYLVKCGLHQGFTSIRCYKNPMVAAKRKCYEDEDEDENENENENENEDD